jgi:hypothetical protein
MKAAEGACAVASRTGAVCALRGGVCVWGGGAKKMGCQRLAPSSSTSSESSSLSHLELSIPGAILCACWAASHTLVPRLGDAE